MDLSISLLCHALLIGALLLGQRATQALDVQAATTDGLAVSDARKAASAEEARAAEEAEATALAAALAAVDPATASATSEPVRSVEETSKALMGEEVSQSVTSVIPEGAPDSVKAGVTAALDKAVAEIMANASNKDGEPMTPGEIELAAAEAVAGQLRSEVSGEFAGAAANDYPRRAFDSALGALEKAAAAEIGPKMREILTGDGAEMATAEEGAKTKAEADAAAAKAAAEAPPDASLSPKDAEKARKLAAKAAADAEKAAAAAAAAADPAKASARLALHDKDAFHKSLDAEAKNALGGTAAAILADNAAATVSALLAKEMITADPAALAKLREDIAKGVATNAASRGFNTSAAWKPSAELVLPGTRRETQVAAPLAAKLTSVGGKQDAMIKEAIPRLAAQTAQNVKWNSHFAVSNETKGKITTIHRLETHISNIKAGRVGAAESSLAASLSSLLGGSGPGVANLSGDQNNYQTKNGLGGSGRNFKEDEYQKLIARLGGRPAGAGADADLQRVAGEAVQTGTAQAGAGAPERMVSLRDPATPAPASAPAEPIAAPPFPSVIHTAAPYAVARPTIDGDLSDWQLGGPRAEVRTLENNTKLTAGPDVFLQWRAEGLYFAYRLADTGGLQISNGAPYHGDCVELFVDASNSRSPRMRESNTAHQYFFMPFGYKGDATATFQRARSGADKPIGKDLTTLNRERNVSFCTAKPEPGGYMVEGFLTIAALERRFAPGIYLGFDVSVSPDFSFQNQIQWAAAKSLGNWDRPCTWGDLLLLGTSAKAAIRSADGSPRQVAVAGESLHLEIADADMNLDVAVRETVAIRLAASTGASPHIILLTETGADTGIFQSSILLESTGEINRPGILNVTGGDAITMTYIDAVNASGTRNKPVSTQLDVGWPVMRFGSR